MNTYKRQHTRSEVRRMRARGNVAAVIQKAKNHGVPWRA
jgi:hypothetical protein